MKSLIKLYPAWWRRRYGGELEALVEDSGSRAAWDLFRGAMEMQMKTWSFGRIVTACGIAGVVLTGIVAFLMPDRYRSTAILKAESEPKEFARVTEAAFTRNALTTIIVNQKLYRRERTRRQMEDVIERMRREIRITPVAPNLTQISFAYEDPVQARLVSQELAGRIIYANLTTPNGGLIQLVTPADEAKKQVENKRYGLAGLGLPVGLLLGVVLALILRRRRAPAAS